MCIAYICSMEKFGIWTLRIITFALLEVGCKGFVSMNKMGVVPNTFSNATLSDTMKKGNLETQVNRTENYKKLELQLEMQGGSSEGAEKADVLLFKDNLKPNFANYSPKSVHINDLKGALEYHPDIKILIYGGNWCPDTHEGVPALLKVLDEAGFNSNNMEYHWVTRDKQMVDGQKTDLEIASVPWIRVFENGILKGEIVEFPQKSWEFDLWNMLK